MTVRVRGGRFMLDIRHHLEDGRVERIRVAVPEDKQSRRAAEAYERTVLADLRAGIDPRARSPVAVVERAVPTLAAFADEYLTHVTTTNRPRYARIKACIIRGRLLPRFGALRLDRIGRREIEAFRSERIKTVAAKTVNHEVGILLHMLATARDFELVATVPKVRPLRIAPVEIGYLADDEQRRLVATARREGGAWAAMIVTALRTGLRLGELRALRWKDVDLVAGRIVVRYAADDRNEMTPPKSGKPREVPLGDEVAAELRSHKHLRGPLVFCGDDGSILGEGQCRHVMERLMRRAGLATGEGQWHLARHTFASELVMRGVPLRTVQELLGHQSLAMVLRYAHLSPDAKRDAVRTLDRGHTLGTVEGEIAKASP